MTVEQEKSTEEKSLPECFPFRKNTRPVSRILLFAAAVVLEAQSWSVWLFLVRYVMAGGKVVYITAQYTEGRF